MIAWLIIFTILLVLSFRNFGYHPQIVRIFRVTLTLFVVGSFALWLVG